MRLNTLGEFGLIDRIAANVRQAPGVVIGIGDDAAATTATPGTVTLVTSDMLVERVHFDFDFCDPVTLGRKALAVNLSDMAAMGGRPRSFLLSLAIPPHFSVEAVDGLCRGLLERAEEFGVTLIGGDTCASRSDLVISITLLGEQLPEFVVRRSGARSGHLICVTGEIGESALGLELLRRGERGGWVVARHLDPVPRVREGLLLAEARLPSAMIDVSDGLLADLGHILRQSGAGARLETAGIPISDRFREVCRRAGEDPLQLALAGGEDYELLFTIPPEAHPAAVDLLSESGVKLSVIGEVTDGDGLSVFNSNGLPYPVRFRGYDHFSPQE